MLEKPNLDEGKICACLEGEFRLSVHSLGFLPLGADVNTAVYRAEDKHGAAYFVKLRGGDFNPVTVTLPKALNEQGLAQIIAPLETPSGRLWADLEAYKLILYPFVEGQDGYNVMLSAQQWEELGVAIKTLHSASLPPALLKSVPQESYAPRYRQAVRTFVAQAEAETFTDPAASQLAALLRDQRALVLQLVERAERLGQALQAQAPSCVVCHSDLHAGNLHITPQGRLYIVDWDGPILAPKERDLMFFGGGQGFRGYAPQEEEALFYRGYGAAQINQAALAYYRYERIVQDIAAFCEQILATSEGGEDRAQSLHYVKANFLPGGTIEIAYQADRTSATR